jgi:hypothetical protein
MTKFLTTDTDPARFIGSYGQTWRWGLLSEHLDLFVRAGGTHRPSRSDKAGWAVVDGVAYPVVCSEIVRVDTEDGPVSGRCGANAIEETGTCEAHDPR